MKHDAQFYHDDIIKRSLLNFSYYNACELRLIISSMVMQSALDSACSCVNVLSVRICAFMLGSPTLNNPNNKIISSLISKQHQ